MVVDVVVVVVEEGGFFSVPERPRAGRRGEREEFVVVWILREEGSVFLGGVSVACPCV